MSAGIYFKARNVIISDHDKLVPIHTDNPFEAVFDIFLDKARLEKIILNEAQESQSSSM